MNKINHYIFETVTTVLMILYCTLIYSCNKSDDNATIDNDYEDQSSTTVHPTASQYYNTYQIWEKDAKSQYNSLISALSRKNPSPELLNTLRNCLQKDQRNMKKVRLEALKNGFNIEISKYENVWA